MVGMDGERNGSLHSNSARVAEGGFVIQLQYRIPKGMKPTTKQIAEWRESFIQGRQVPGIRIRAIDWRDGGSQVEIRERLKKPWRASVAVAE